MQFMINGASREGRGIRRAEYQWPTLVAARARWAARPILRLEAFRTAPGFDQRAVHREMLARQQPFYAGMGHHGGQELHRDLARQQPVTVLGEGRGVPHRVIHAEPTNQRNSKSKSMRSTSCRSDRIL
jgi:hypothetical protein